jgi:hypothetical protein
VATGSNTGFGAVAAPGNDWDEAVLELSLPPQADKTIEPANNAIVGSHDRPTILLYVICILTTFPAALVAGIDCPAQLQIR